MKIRYYSCFSCLILVLFVLTNTCISSQIKIYPPAKYQNLKQEYLFSISSGCPAKLHLSEQNNDQILKNLSKQEKIRDWIQYYIDKINNRQIKMSQCLMQNIESTYFIQIFINKNIKQEGYKLLVKQQKCEIQVSSYKGYVYAMETLSQLINDDEITLGFVEDEPQVEYRGIMIDSVRHFLSFEYVERLIQSMPVSKLNMLHWHLADDQTFVLQLFSHPQLSSASAYDYQSYYTIDQVLSLISLGQKNGVNLIPQFDSPAHVRSWGLAYQWKTKNITILCPKGEHYNHQFDLSKPQVYTLVAEVLNQVRQFFQKSPYLHLGGDQVFGSCWDLRPEIKQFMQKNNIKDYGQLQMYWRERIKRQAHLQNRTIIYWRNDAANVETKPDQVLQFWGAQKDVARIIANSSSKVILSPSDYLYLNKGQSFIWQNGTFGPYITWKQIYEGFKVFPDGVQKQRILGAQACLWGEVSNQFTLQNNLWPRAAAFAFKVWSNQIMNTYQLFSALVNTKNTLQSMGVQCSPVSSEYCQKNPKICFPPPSKEKSILQTQ